MGRQFAAPGYNSSTTVGGFSMDRPSVFVAAVGGLLLGAHLFAQDVGQQRKQSRETEAAWKRQEAKIDAELADLKEHPWAGQYYFGDGLGVNARLKLAPKSGVVFIWTGCLGVYDRNYGKVIEDNGLIKLALSLPNDRQGFQGVATELAPVIWGPRHYLISVEELPAFCSAVNSGLEPREGTHGLYFLRAGDESKSICGQPEIPPQFRGYLLKTPVNATIQSVTATVLRPGLIKDMSFRETTVLLTSDQPELLKPQMELHVIDESVVPARATITSVDGKRIEASISQIITAEVNEPAPKVGWKLSTRAPWRTGCEKHEDGGSTATKPGAVANH